MNRQIKADEGKGVRVPPQDTRPHKAYSPGDAGKCHGYLTHNGGSTVLALCLAYTYSTPMPQHTGPNREDTTMARAYYYASGKNKFLEVQGKRIAVSGMREARKLCKDLNAQPWNF